MKINDEGSSNAAHWHERAMKAEAWLAAADALLMEARSIFEQAPCTFGSWEQHAYMSAAARIDAHLAREAKP